MKRPLLILFTLLCVYSTSHAQSISLPPSGDNQKSSVTQWMGLASVTITYNSPNVTGPQGEDRKGHIWGEVVHYGFIDQGFGTSKAAPWRAGANENTTITFSHDVKVSGKDLKAGTYGLFLDVEKEGPWYWIFSSASTNWGSYFYDPKEDVLRIETQPTDAAYTEYLTFGFDDRELNSATAFLQWEHKRVPFKIEVPNGIQLYVDKIRSELHGERIGFTYQPWVEAIQFCVQHNVNLDEALTWADVAISEQFIGRENFATLQAKAQVLQALKRETEADDYMQRAIKHPTATVQDIHAFGRSLINAGKTQKALEVFKYNRQQHPDDKFTTYVGLARGYTGVGDKKNAIKNWEIAIKNLPENQKQFLPQYEAELKKLSGQAN